MTWLGMQRWLHVCNRALPAWKVHTQFCVCLFIGLSREMFVRHKFELEVCRRSIITEFLATA